MTLKEEITRYYDYTIPFWKVFWHRGTGAIHYGFWDNQTKDLKDALINTNKVLSEIVQVNASSKVLDAGSGIGSSSIWMAENVGCEVVGITLAPRQKAKAETYARAAGVQNKTAFYVMDYSHTDFPNETFDVVWALESVCHEKDKSDFIHEAYRILKRGGKIIVADGFLKRAPHGEHEERTYQVFLKGFVLDNLASVDEFRSNLASAGFHNIKYFDKTDSIAKTSQLMYELCKNWYWVNRIARALRLIPQLMLDNVRTGIAQFDFFKGPGVYSVFVAEK